MVGHHCDRLWLHTSTWSYEPSPLAKGRVLRNLKPRPPPLFLASQGRISETSPKSRDLSSTVTPGLPRSANLRGRTWTFTATFTPVAPS